MNNALLIARDYLQNINVDETYFVNNLIKTLSYLDEETQLNFIATMYELAPVLKPGTKVYERCDEQKRVLTVVSHNPVTAIVKAEIKIVRFAKENNHNPTMNSTMDAPDENHPKQVFITRIWEIDYEDLVIMEDSKESSEEQDIQ